MAALASGALVALALPPLSYGPLVWIALVPLLRLRRRETDVTLFGAACVAVLVPTVSVTRWLDLPALSPVGFGAALTGGPLLFALAAVGATRIEERVRSPALGGLVWPTAAAVADGILHLVVAAVPVPVDLMVPSLLWAFHRHDVMVQSFYLAGTSAVVVFVVVAANVGVEAGLVWIERVVRTGERRAHGLGPAAVGIAICVANGTAGLWYLAKNPPPPVVAAGPARQEK